MTGALGSGEGRVLLPRPAGAPPELPTALQALGWTVLEVPAYETRAAAGDVLNADVIADDAYDLVSFASPSAVDAFVARFGRPERAVACIGTATADAARRHGLVPEVVPTVHSADALAAAIAEYLRK